MWVVCTGIVCLALAMGVGRFAFTPLLPLMLRDGMLDTVAGVDWATANYIGYLLGAVTAARFSAQLQLGMLLGLGGVTMTTLAISLLDATTPVVAGLVLRCGAGVFSAWVLICTSSWALAEFAGRHVPHFSSWIYTGVGLGIMMVGLHAWLGGHRPAQQLWLEVGLLAAGGTAFVAAKLQYFKDQMQTLTAVSPPLCIHFPQTASAPWRLVLCYGIFGFGYIMPATFLPAIAQQQVSDPNVFGLTWPLFGLFAVLSVVMAALVLSSASRKNIWVAAQTMLAAGVALPLATQALWALALSAVLVGGTFMVITMAGLQLARQQYPHTATILLARMTMAFAIGQIMGPLLVRVLGTANIYGQGALTWASAIASLLLLASALWLWKSIHSPASTP
jgi:MFS family permease